MRAFLNFRAVAKLRRPAIGTRLLKNIPVAADQEKPSAKRRQAARSTVKAARAATPQILIQATDRRRGRAQNITRTRDRVGGDRRAAGQRLQHHQTERIRPAREHEHIGGGIGAGQRLARQHAGEAHIGKRRSRPDAVRPVTHHQLRSRQIQARGKPRCSSRPPGARHRGRPAAAASSASLRSVGVKPTVSTPRVQWQTLAKPRRRQLADQARRRRHDRRGRRRGRSASSDRRRAPSARAEMAAAPRDIPGSGYGRRW